MTRDELDRVIKLLSDAQLTAEMLNQSGIYFDIGTALVSLRKLRDGWALADALAENDERARA